MLTNNAKNGLSQWVEFCRGEGFDLAWAVDLWWQYHDERGNLRKAAERQEEGE